MLVSKKLYRRSFMGGLTALPVISSGSTFGRTPPAVTSRASVSPGQRTLEGTWIDLGQAKPTDALSAVPGLGQWQSVRWKAQNGDQVAEGTMLLVGPEGHPPELVIDPKLTGPHEIFVGLPSPAAYDTPNPIRIKLDNDPCYRLMVNEKSGVTPPSRAQRPRKGIEDARFGAVDMTGRRIHLSQFRKIHSGPAGIAYIRAVPVSESDLDRNRKKGLRLVALNDGHGTFYSRRPPMTEQDLWEDIIPYRDSGFSSLIWQITGADQCNYPTKVGTLMGTGLDYFPRTGDRYYTENLKGLFAAGIDPVASVIRMCRSIGLECHLAIRPQAFALEPPFDGFFHSPFYAANPSLRCVDRDGRRISRLSYAYPEVREHIFAIVDELVKYQPDGINFIFCRGIPCVLYEEPFLREFRSRHGRDARKLPEDHPDVLALRADIMGRFMQELRRRTRGASGRRLEISAIVLADQAANRLYGLDVVRWARERWVDEISPSVYTAFRGKAEPQCAYLVEACRQSGCRLVVNLLPRGITPAEYIPKALRYRAEGAQGFSFWDTSAQKSTEWALLRAIGRLGPIRRWRSLSPHGAGNPAADRIGRFRVGPLSSHLVLLIGKPASQCSIGDTTLALLALLILEHTVFKVE